MTWAEAHPVAVLRSVIAPESIARALAGELGFRQVRCRFLHHGFNDTYEGEAGGVPLIVRLYRHGWRTLEEVEAECKILMALAGAGLSVSAPFAGPTGRFLFSLSAPEGPRLGVVFSRAKGNIPLDLDARSHQLLGCWLGDLHAHLNPLEDLGRARPVLDLEFFLARPLKTLREAFPERGAELQQLENHLTGGNLVPPPFSGENPDFGLVHGDFLRVNFFRDETGVFTLFDFDFCGFSHRSYDLATFRWSIDASKGPSAGGAWEEFLTGYQSRHPVCERELSYVDWFVQVRQLWVWGVNVESGDGFQRLNEHQFRARMAWFGL